jgi:hypothetical protein
MAQSSFTTCFFFRQNKRKMAVKEKRLNRAKFFIDTAVAV